MSSQPSNAKIVLGALGFEGLATRPGCIVASCSTELFRSIACAICAATAVPGALGSFTPSPISASHLACGSLRVGQVAASTVLWMTAPRSTGNRPSA